MVPGMRPSLYTCSLWAPTRMWTTPSTTFFLEKIVVHPENLLVMNQSHVAGCGCHGIYTGGERHSTKKKKKKKKMRTRGKNQRGRGRPRDCNDGTSPLPPKNERKSPHRIQENRITAGRGVTNTDSPVPPHRPSSFETYQGGEEGRGASPMGTTSEGVVKKKKKGKKK